MRVVVRLLLPCVAGIFALNAAQSAASESVPIREPGNVFDPISESSGGNGKEMIPTKRFEAFREGLEDVAYMDRLKKELARHKAAGRSFPQYGELLAVREVVVKANGQKKVDEWRLAVGRAIDMLTK